MKTQGKKKGKKKELTPKELAKKIFKGLRPISKMNFMESFAMFIGKVQLVELALKNLLISRYGYSEDTAEKWSLGGVIQKLRSHGIRSDFISILEELRKHRNLIAHELLAVNAIGRSLMGTDFDRLSWKPLRNGLFLVEEVIHVYDFLIENELLVPPNTPTDRA